MSEAQDDPKNRSYLIEAITYPIVGAVLMLCTPAIAIYLAALFAARWLAQHVSRITNRSKARTDDPTIPA